MIAMMKRIMAKVSLAVGMVVGVARAAVAGSDVPRD
jgi:hypothetical protein